MGYGLLYSGLALRDLSTSYLLFVGGRRLALPGQYLERLRYLARSVRAQQRLLESSRSTDRVFLQPASVQSSTHLDPCGYLPSVSLRCDLHLLAHQL
jgi:hypothetical protein